MTLYLYRNGSRVQIAGAKEKLCVSGRVEELEHTTSGTDYVYAAVAMVQEKRYALTAQDKVENIILSINNSELCQK